MESWDLLLSKSLRSKQRLLSSWLITRGRRCFSWTDLILRPLHLIDVEFSRLIAGPFGSYSYRSISTAFWHFVPLIIPLSSQKLVTNTCNCKSTMLRVHIYYSIQKSSHIVMVILNNLSLRLFAFRKWSELLNAGETKNFSDIPTVVEWLHEINWVFDVVYEFLNE